MSYAFNIRAANKAEAIAAVRANVAAIVKGQPIHGKDEGAILCNAHNVVDALADDATCDVAVSLTGFVSSRDGSNLRTVSIACQATLMMRDAGAL